VKTPYPDLEYFRRAAFLKSVEQLKDLPADEGAEVAFIGRSNVGKSSVLNALCDHQGLARTSRTPGRTQHFVVFDLGGPRRLIDLPGFGYAVVNKAMRAHWDEMIPRYLEERASLAGLVLIADARHPLKSEELALIEWTASACVPQTLLLNKADKLGRQAIAQAVRAARESVGARGGDPASVHAFSAVGKEGVPHLRAMVDDWLMQALTEGPGQEE
jgi:GTP-binding protein